MAKSQVKYTRSYKTVVHKPSPTGPGDSANIHYTYSKSEEDTIEKDISEECIMIGNGSYLWNDGVLTKITVKGGPPKKNH